MPPQETLKRHREAASCGQDAAQREDNGDESPKKTKRRRIGKVLDKKYHCPHGGCEKSYSRAEHMYRHQLNHAPKEIYECDYPGCVRTFVRQDLCTRHKGRHIAKKSGLVRTSKSKYDPDIAALSLSTSRTRDQPGKEYTARRDSTLAATPCLTSGAFDTLGHGSQGRKASPVSDNATRNQDAMSADRRRSTNHNVYAATPHVKDSSCSPEVSHRITTGSLSTSTSQIPLSNADTYFDRSRNNSMHFDRAGQYNPLVHFDNHSTQTSVPPLTRPSIVFQGEPDTNAPFVPSYPTLSNTKPNHQNQPFVSPRISAAMTLQGPVHDFSGMNPIPPYDHQSASPNVSSESRRPSMVTSPPPMSQGHYHTALNGQHGFPNAPIEPENSTAIDMPIFTDELYSHAPFSSADDFTAWLFNDDAGFDTSPPAAGLTHHEPLLSQFSPIDTSTQRDPGLMSSTFTEDKPPTSTLAATRLSHELVESVISKTRRRRLLDFIIGDFHDRRHAFVTETRRNILHGNHDSPNHVLSLDMLQTYMISFWVHVHQQMPILHRPTFDSEACPDLLLISMLALGASNLDRSHSFETRQACSDLSFFLAWHTRFRIYQEVDFGPPAKLWIFQALLLLEIFEKLFSTRSLHERAHVHHATTLTLMRRGSSLVGRLPMDFPPSHEDATRTPPKPNGSINMAGYNTPDVDWNAWISAEATKRIAFAAFIIDTTHATMFGHSAVMVAHEMRISLPCEESMWSASSMAEVNRIRQNIEARDAKQVTFLEALKKTLNYQKVHTNTFGRVIIMAGLLSVSWHMKMQDVRVSSVGVGKQGSWGSQLLHAFDFWKSDFDAFLAVKTHNSFYRTLSHGRNHDPELPPVNNGINIPSSMGIDTDNVFESRTVLHHLAHMAMHCDVLDVQIFAGATRLLGRAITSQEQIAARRRMRETWAPSARARDATFYALRFLSEVLVPEDHASTTNSSSSNHNNSSTNNGSSSSTHPAQPSSILPYSARDDVLLNRPWVLYLATLIVWAYGYALEGAIAPPTYTLSSRETQIHDMQGFLRRVGGVRTPEALGQMRQRNSCLGLLMLVRDVMGDTRWELLHEASGLLGGCVEMLMPGTGTGTGTGSGTGRGVRGRG